MNEEHYLSDEDIKKVELDALIYIRQICQEYHLRYYLAYGTLLGAVRHQGFIPWDDDIDILMPRRDYERLLQITSSLNHERYKVVYNQKDKDYYYPHAKLVDTHTICVEKGLYPIRNMGVWIDLFPMDGMPGRFRLHYMKMRILNKMRALSVHRILPKVSVWAFPIVYLVWKMTQLVGFQYFINQMERLACKCDYELSDYVSCIVEPDSVKCIYEKDIFASSVSLSFENESFEVPVLYKKYLEYTYGDYMQLPPIEKRLGHSFEAQWTP